MFNVIIVDNTRRACSIELEEIVILTGGFFDNRVTVYSNDGFLTDWPSLNQHRWLHGCGHFVNTENNEVNK